MSPLNFTFLDTQKMEVEDRTDTNSNVSGTSLKRKSRLGVCVVCAVEEAKYTCPACEITSCSLKCSNKHKVESGCDGIRIRTSFVKLNEFGNLHLLSDYRLLDDISCKVDACRRDKLNKVPTANHFQNKSSKLKHAVLSRGADFVILPNQFARHRKNYSVFDSRKKQISWMVQLTFLNAAQLTVFERCSEETVLEKLVQDCLKSEANKLKFKKVETYRKIELSSSTVLLKAERVPESDKKFYKLDMGKNLRENFIGKTIVEFPQLYVLIDGCFRSTTVRTKNGTVTTGSKTEQNWLLPTTATAAAKPTAVRNSSIPEVSSSSDESSGEEPDEFAIQLGSSNKLPSYRDLVGLHNF